MAELNSPLILGGLHLKNRVVMAALIEAAQQMSACRPQ